MIHLNRTMTCAPDHRDQGGAVFAGHAKEVAASV
jgi:hypothetical protein